METKNAIEIRDVSKGFRIYGDKGSELKEKLLFHRRNNYQVHEVLRGVSFNIARGEAVGLIGENGCGKSTLLKLISQIIYPDAGEIRTYGRISGLIELGAGFHPDMTGRENIYINSSIYGLSKKETDARLDDIIGFSGLKEFIDTPIRTYSSGMYMRLGFSVAINVSADILLIDEILAVGDLNFQEKCFEYLRMLKGQGVTIVIVSHSLGQIQEICDTCYWVGDGGIMLTGKPETVCARYVEAMQDKRES